MDNSQNKKDVLTSQLRKSFAELLAEDPSLAQKITHCAPGVAWGAMGTVRCTVRLNSIRSELAQGKR